MRRFFYRNYARALYETSKEGKAVSYVLDNLKKFKEILVLLPDFKYLLENSRFPLEQKRGLLEKFFEGEGRENLINFVSLLIAFKKLDYLEKIINEFESLLNAEENRSEVLVYSAYPINEKLKNQLIEVLEKKVSQKVIINNQIDKSLLGGIKIKMGDLLIDGTLSGRFFRMKNFISTLK